MNKTLAFAITSASVAIPLYLITLLDAYKEVQENILFVTFMLLVFIALGSFVATQLTDDKPKKKKKDKKEVMHEF